MKLEDLVMATIMMRGTRADVTQALILSQATWCGVDFLIYELPLGVLGLHLVLGNGGMHPPDECLCGRVSNTSWGACWVHGKAAMRVKQAEEAVHDAVAAGIIVCASYGPVWTGEILNAKRYPRPMRLMPRATLDALSVHVDRGLERGRSDMPRWATRVAEEYAHRAARGEPERVMEGERPFWKVRA